MRRTLYWAAPAAVLLLAALFWRHTTIERQLGDPQVLTGWTTLVAMLFLALFNSRKKLSMIPLGRASTWLALHVIIGVALLPAYWIHTGTLWPSGVYEQILAGVFYLACLTGIAGYALTRVMPRRVNAVGGEIILERIPAEIVRIREAAQAAVRGATEASGNETLVRQYQEMLAWFFARPRFLVSHLSGAARPKAWIENRHSTITGYLGDSEKPYFDEIMALMRYKNQVDAQYAGQMLLRIWLLTHLPVSAATILLALWHTLLVHVYLL